MPQVPYNKQALTFQQQLQQLKNRGLIIEDDEKAIHLLENISYYRLSGYWYPLIKEPKSDHLFKPDSSFNQSFSLYCFDREFRQLVSAELEKIEVAIRAKMIYILSHANGPFWYNDVNLFANQDMFANTLKKLSEEYGRSKEEFILAFNVHYTDPLPPSWMILEISSFGILSSLYKNLKRSRERREIAQHFGLDERTFQSWLHGIVYIRNVCAHHAKLWNRKLSIAPVIPNNPSKKWLMATSTVNSRSGIELLVNNRPYYILSMILYLLQTINPQNTFKDKILNLFSKYPNVDPAALGFTRNWKNEQLWQ